MKWFWGALFTVWAATAYAEERWVLYPPSDMAPDASVSGESAAFVAELLGAYFDPAHAPLHTNLETPEAKQAACVRKLTEIVRSLDYSLSGFSYDLNLKIEGASWPLESIACRVTTERTTEVAIEVEEN